MMVVKRSGIFYGISQTFSRRYTHEILVLTHSEHIVLDQVLLISLPEHHQEYNDPQEMISLQRLLPQQS